MRLVRQSGLLQHDRDLDAVGCRQRIKLNPVGMLRRPFCRDGEGGEIGHGYPFKRSDFRTLEERARRCGATARRIGCWFVWVCRTTNIDIPATLVFLHGTATRP